MEKILRFLNAELRAADDSEAMTVEGYALKFDKETMIGSAPWGWREKISRTALDGAKLDDVVFNFNHMNDKLLARTLNRSLLLQKDTVGLKMSAQIIDTATGRDVYKLIQSGLIMRMSFAATIKTSVWTISENEEDLDMREITAVDRLFDVSAVTFPAYEDTAIAVSRGIDSIDTEAKRHLEQKKYGSQIARLNQILGGIKK